MNIIKFAHLSDLHLGGWRQKTLTDLNFKTFSYAIDKIIKEKVDFCLICGDIFDQPIPKIELVENTIEEFLKLKNSGIEIFIIGGSHDYNSNQKSFLTLLEKTGLFVDCSKYEIIDKDKIKLKFQKHKKTGTIISGILGKKNGLDKNIYLNLEKLNLDEFKNNLKIFMFHSTIDELVNLNKNEKIIQTGISKSFLPKGFDYYAGGHIHKYILSYYNEKPISYSGTIFPNNFLEMKKEKPTFNICIYNKSTKIMKVEKKYINSFENAYVKIEIENLTPILAKEKIENIIENTNIKNKIVLLEIFGTVDGKVIDIGIDKIINNLYNQDVIYVLKNTYKLSSNLLKEIKVVNEDVNLIEKEQIENVIEKSNERELINNLLDLDLEKKEDEKIYDFEKRIIKIIDEKVKNYN
jgi:DNA repair protein SbcD/Mre11